VITALGREQCSGDHVHRLLVKIQFEQVAELGRANMKGSGTSLTAARQRIALPPSGPSLAVISK